MLPKICVTLYTLTMAHLIKNLSALWENWVWSLGWDDPLQKGMATHSSILAWKIPWTEEHGKLHFMEWQRHQHDWVTNTLHSHQLCTRVFTFPHLYWCLGNPDTNCCTSEVWEMVSPCGFTCLLVRLNLNLNLSWVWAGLKLSIKKKKKKTELMTSGPITSWHIEGGKWKHWQILFSWALKSLLNVTAALK